MIIYYTEVLDENAKRYPSDSAERWRQMDPLWGRMASLVANLPIKLLYLEVSCFAQKFPFSFRITKTVYFLTT